MIRLVGPPLNKQEWHPWFAWFPVRITTESGTAYIVWLEHIERRVLPSTYDEWPEYRFTRRPEEGDPRD